MNPFEVWLAGKKEVHYTFCRIINPQQRPAYGQATFLQLHPHHYLYQEQGTYWATNRPQRFQQTRLWYFTTEQVYILNAWSHLLLHTFICPVAFIRPVSQSSVYHCANDAYTLTITLLAPYKWATQYVIQGPAKNYYIQTMFTHRAVGQHATLF